MIEHYVVASWDEHLRQLERVTRRDQDRLDRVKAMTDPDHPETVATRLAVTTVRLLIALGR
jgi:Transmembrane secretion effector